MGTESHSVVRKNRVLSYNQRCCVFTRKTADSYQSPLFFPCEQAESDVAVCSCEGMGLLAVDMLLLSGPLVFFGKLVEKEFPTGPRQR